MLRGTLRAGNKVIISDTGGPNANISNITAGGVLGISAGSNTSNRGFLYFGTSNGGDWDMAMSRTGLEIGGYGRSN